MKSSIPRIENSFRQLLVTGLEERCLRLPIGLFAFFILLGLINFSKGGSIWGIFSRLLEPTGFKGIPSKFDPPVLIFLLIAGLLDALVWAVYWYIRVRNPSYIKKQEAYERWKAEKAAKQASPDSPGKSGETSADQVR